MIEALRAEVQQLRKENEELRARLKRDSGNSSQPPSSDPPWKPPAERRGKGRKRGGQPGHRGHRRELVAADEVVIVKPERCLECNEALSGDDAEPWRHQVTEIPAVTAHVTEYQVHALKCGDCGCLTRAPLPAGVPSGVFGPRLQAMVAVCSGAYRLSKRSIEEILGDFFGVRISLGSVSNLEAATSEALAQPYEEAVAMVRKARVLHADETHWRKAAQHVWLWVAVTASAVIYFIRDSRSKTYAQELVGAGFPGVLITDQYPGYHWFRDERRQFCWAHLIRHFRALGDFDDSKAFGDRLLGFTEKIFDAWHRSRARTISWSELRAEMQPIQAEFGGVLRDGAASSSLRVRSMCKGLLRHEASLWTFVRRSGVSPTNNAAERAIRPAVLWRKNSFGSDSERGTRFAERILSVVATLRLHHLPVLEFVAQSCRASLLHSPPPHLIPAGA